MNRREFIGQVIGGGSGLCFSALGLPPDIWGDLLGFLQAGSLRKHPAAQSFNDLAEYEEVKHPLLAGEFDEAIQFLLPRLEERPGPIAYALSTIYFLTENYVEGIPYALRACQADSKDIRYLWMLRTLTLMAGKPENSIPAMLRLVVPAGSRASFRLEDVTDVSGTGRVALGRGAAWGDFDNDGREDILVGAERAPFCLLRNLGNGKFENVAARMGLIDPAGLGCYAAQFIDYDNDGFQDVFLSSNGWGGGGRLYLFHNEQGRKFSDVTASAGLGEPLNAFGASWADYDNDGRPDLAVATGIVDPKDGDRIRLFHNEGNGKFRETGLAVGLLQKAKWISVGWADYDGDGRQDLLATSYDAGCFLFRNMGNGRFEDVSQRAGVRNPLHAYTAEFLDFDNDGRLDLFVSTYPNGSLQDMIANKMSGATVPRDQRQLLFRNNGDGTFIDVTLQAGITGWYGAMSSQVADLDNDGFSEVLLGTGNPELDWAEPKPLLRNNGKGRFADVAESAGLVHFGMLHGMAFSDYDDSGNLSLFGSFGGFYWGTRLSSRLYRNAGNGNHALEIRLVGTRSNRDAIGAHVTCVAGGRQIHKWVNGGDGFGCLNSRIVHIGLGQNARVDNLQIDWPSGLRQLFKSLPADQRVEIREGSAAVTKLARLSANK